MSVAAAPTLTTAPSVVRALLEGEIVVDVRLATDPAPAVGERVWLVAAAEDPELKAAYRMVRELSTPETGPPAVHGWAEVSATGRATLDPERCAALGPKTPVSLEALSEMEVVVLVLRTYRLAEPLDPDDLPADPGGRPAVSALSNVAFEAKQQGVADALPRGLRR